MSDTETALCCMIVSNPTGGERPHAWQKRVNDHMRAQAAEIARLTAERDEAQAETLEQARLNGMGSQREWALMSKLREKEAALAAKDAEIVRLTTERNYLLSEGHDGKTGLVNDAHNNQFCQMQARAEAAEAQAAEAYARGIRDAAGACDLASQLMASGVAVNDDDIPSYCKGLILALLPEQKEQG